MSLRGLVLAVILMAAGAPTPSAEAVEAPKIASVQLPCLSKSVIGAVKTTGSIDAAVEACDAAIESIFAERPAFRYMGPEERRVVLAAVIAYEWAPYGNSTERRFPQILQQRHLDCDNYAALTGHLAKSRYLQYAGFDGGAVGNHAQLFFRRGEVRLLLDPTIGLVAATGFNATLSGKPVDPVAILSFRSRDELSDFNDVVIGALTMGSYRPRDMLYFYDALEDFVTKLDTDFPRFPTPGGANLRSRLIQ